MSEEPPAVADGQPACGAGTTFRSILFEREEEGVESAKAAAPAFFVNLNLDQIVAAITAGKEDYDLKPFFHAPLKSISAIKYRHDVLRDLGNVALLERVKAFAQRMRDMREHLAQAEKLRYKHQKDCWFLDAAEIYCDAVGRLTRDLSLGAPASRGFLGLREYLTAYSASVRFTSLLAETRKLKADLSAVRYSVLIKGAGFTVRRYGSEADYSADVDETFAKFKQGAAKDYLVKFSAPVEMNHIEAKILDFVAQLYDETFRSLAEYHARNSGYLDATIATFDREIQFYVAHLEHVALLERAGLKFCYPKISDGDKEVYDFEGFDLALAHKLAGESASVVCNDFHLKGKERIFVVTGPNQGGKTTFARTFGQLHYLGSLGCLVPGRDARLFLFDNIFTHFEKEEDIKTLRGKLEDDLIRIRAILDRATPRSIVIMNEIFTSTTLSDAIFLSRMVMERVLELDLLGICVTFIDELASLGEKTVSVASTVVPDNPAQRTFKIVRKPADGLAYAMAIAEKRGLTYGRLKERIKP